jgi:hypothetical protein
MKVLPAMSILPRLDLSAVAGLSTLYNGPITDHFYTVSEEERIGAIVKFGYADEGVVGWVLSF